jgi:hypothetical protein
MPKPRLLPSLVALLALAAATAEAAPAPFARPGQPPPGPEVELHGCLPDPKLVGTEPRLIASQWAYEAVARAWRIASPPRVDFRTHFLVVAASRQPARVVCELKDGDLRVTAFPRAFRCEAPPDGFYYHIRSFPRAGVVSVDGVPLPPRR